MVVKEAWRAVRGRVEVSGKMAAKGLLEKVTC